VARSTTRDAPQIGSRRFHNLRLIAYRRIIAQVIDLWRPWSAEWAIPKDLKGRKNAERRLAAVAKADDGITSSIASILATAVVLDIFDRRYRPRTPSSAKRVRRSRALADASLSLTDVLRISWEAQQERLLHEAALERHHSAYHVERVGAGRGRPSSPGLDHAVDGLRIVFDNASSNPDLYGLRLRPNFARWKFSVAVLRRLRLRTKGSGALKFVGLVHDLRPARAAHALQDLATRLARTQL
jgi:hypothetical protein